MSDNKMVNPRIRGHQVTGNVVNDPKVITYGDSRTMVVFRVADNHRRFDRDAKEWVDTGATFYDVSIQDNRHELGQNVLNSIRTGNRVTVSGTYDTKAYVNSQGEPSVGHRIAADDVSASLTFNQVRIGPSAVTKAEATATPAVAHTAASEAEGPVVPPEVFQGMH